MNATDNNSIASQLPAGLLDNIVANINPKRVILFGSRARGAVHKDSDWDLLIIVDDETTQEQVNWRVMGKVRRGIRGAVDLIPFRETTFRDRQNTKGSLPWIAATEGMVVYERADAA